jgi:hypothetical protein
MSLEANLTQVFEDNNIKFRKNAQSFVLDCPLCDKASGVYLWKSRGHGKCHKCSASFSPSAFLVTLLGVSYPEARKILNTGHLINSNDRLDPFVLKPPKEEEKVRHFKLPYNFYDFGRPRQENAAGGKYLTLRGVDVKVAKKFDLRYCPATKRVIFPIYDDEGCVGWQARDVTGEAEFPYDSPSGFNRASALLGYRDFDSDHAIVVEGPFDFLKVAPLGGALCTFGKQISNKQIKMIQKLRARNVYLALDPDAFALLDKYAREFEPQQKVWIMEPPSHREDFGDCTLVEVEKAFKNSIRYSRTGKLPVNILEV